MKQDMLVRARNEKELYNRGLIDKNTMLILDVPTGDGDMLISGREILFPGC